MTVLTIIRGIKQDSICKELRLNGVTLSLTLSGNVLFWFFLPAMGWRMQDWIYIKLLYKR